MRVLIGQNLPCRTDTNKKLFTSGSLGSAVITVREVSHGTLSTGDIVRFKKANGFDGFTGTVLQKSSGYSITVTDADNYTFTASSGTATTGGQRGEVKMNCWGTARRIGSNNERGINANCFSQCG